MCIRTTADCSQPLPKRANRLPRIYEDCNYNAATREIMALADKANKFVDDRQPWVIRKDPTKADELREVCSITLNLFRQIVTYLAPVLPELAKQTEELLNRPIAHWSDSQTPLTGTPVSPFTHLMKRIETKQVEAMIEESKEDMAAEQGAAPHGCSGNTSSAAFMRPTSGKTPVTRWPMNRWRMNARSKIS